jgi:hypothetical protein
VAALPGFQHHIGEGAADIGADPVLGEAGHQVLKDV